MRIPSPFRGANPTVQPAIGFERLVHSALMASGLTDSSFENGMLDPAWGTGFMVVLKLFRDPSPVGDDGRTGGLTISSREQTAQLI